MHPLYSSCKICRGGTCDGTRPRVPPSGERCPCNFHPSEWLRASVLTCRLISLVGVKWTCLRIDKQAFPPVCREGVRYSCEICGDSVYNYIHRVYNYIYRVYNHMCSLYNRCLS